MKKEKGIFRKGKLFRLLVFVGMFVFIPLVFAGCKNMGSDTGSGARNYEINYNLNGGTNSVENPETFNKNMSELVLSEPTRAGYIFRGWYTDITFTNRITSIDVNTKGDITIYAKWEIEVYSVTYDLDGGIIDGTNPISYTIEDTIDSAITLLNPTKDGYTFDGWYSNEEFTSDKIETIAQGTTGNMTLYAKFNAHTYTVKFNKNSEYASGSMADQSFTYGHSQRLSSNVFIREGYVLTGWAKYKNGSKEYNDGVEVSNLTTENNGTVELFAVWQAIFTTESTADGEKITGLTAYGKTLTTFEIPSSIDDGEDITLIGTNAFKGAAITSITIPNFITSISEYAFSDCSSLETVAFAEESELTTINTYAFKNCSSLQNIRIPSSVTNMYNYIFFGCDDSLIICCEASATPSGWLSFWNYDSLDSQLNVIWNAAETVSLTTDSAFRYVVLNDETIEIAEYIGAKTIVEIPSQIEDKYASKIHENCFLSNTSITSVTIPRNVTSIGNNAFKDCVNLAEIKFNAVACDDFTSSSYVFKNAGASGDGIAVTFGASVTKIPAYLFYNSDSIKSVTFGENSQLTSIGNKAFYDCGELTSVIIPSCVGRIEERAFAYCVKLTEMIIPEGVTSIGAYAFEYCSSLAEITIPGEVASIGNYAFQYCTNLTKINFNAVACGDFTSSSYVFKNAGTSGDGIAVTFGTSVTKIPAYLFYDSGSTYAPNVISATIPNSVTSIGQRAFECCISLTEITIPEGVTAIGNYAFEGCANLTKINFNAVVCDDCTSSSYVFKNAGTSGDGIAVTFGANVTKIPAYLFYNCDSVKTATFGGSSQFTSIGNRAFSGCSNLAEITILDGITTIGEYAFYNCSSLENVTIGKSSKLQEINSNAFYNCSSLKTVIIPEGVTSIGENAFSNCSSLVLIYYCGTKEAKDDIELGDKVLNNCNAIWCYYSEIQPTDTGDYWHYVNNNPTFWNQTDIFIMDGNTITGVTAYGKSLSTLIIPNSVTSIGQYAFQNCSSLEEITIPQGVTSIGNYAFTGCVNLTKINFNAVACDSFTSSSYVFKNAGTSGDGIAVTFGANVTKIPAYLFYNYDCVKSITFDADSQLTSIGSYAFYYVGLTSVILPSSVDSISDRAFGYCRSLTSIVIPKSVTSIGNAAFYYCDSLATVLYGGTSSEWSSISLSSNNTELKNAKRYYYVSKTEGCICETTGNAWTYDENGQIKKSDDLEWMVDIEPTQTKYGHATKTCPVCGNVYEKTLGMLPKINSSYYWTVNGNSAVSTNHDHSSSFTLTLTANSDCAIRISYKTSSTKDRDKLIIKHDSTTIGTYSGVSTAYTTLSDIKLSAGEKITFTYSKDDSGTDGDDCAWVKWEIVG